MRRAPWMSRRTVGRKQFVGSTSTESDVEKGVQHAGNTHKYGQKVTVCVCQTVNFRQFGMIRRTKTALFRPFSAPTSTTIEVQGTCSEKMI